MKFVANLNVDDCDTRLKASEELATKATLKDLAVLRKWPDLGDEQQYWINKVVREGVKDVWEKFQKTPTKNKPVDTTKKLVSCSTRETLNQYKHKRTSSRAEDRIG